jgi:hypothetical protein
LAGIEKEGKEEPVDVARVRRLFEDRLERANFELDRCTSLSNFLTKCDKLLTIRANFKDLAPGERASEMLTRLREDSNLKRDIEAAEKLWTILPIRDPATIKPTKTLENRLRALAKSYPKTQAGAEAERLLQLLW